VVRWSDRFVKVCGTPAGSQTRVLARLGHLLTGLGGHDPVDDVTRPVLLAVHVQARAKGATGRRAPPNATLPPPRRPGPPRVCPRVRKAGNGSVTHRESPPHGQPNWRRGGSASNPVRTPAAGVRLVQPPQWPGSVRGADPHGADDPPGHAETHDSHQDPGIRWLDDPGQQRHRRGGDQLQQRGQGYHGGSHEHAPPGRAEGLTAPGPAQRISNNVAHGGVLTRGQVL
jgi:hypothetical protein